MYIVNTTRKLTILSNIIDTNLQRDGHWNVEQLNRPGVRKDPSFCHCTESIGTTAAHLGCFVLGNEGHTSGPGKAALVEAPLRDTTVKIR